MEEKKNKKAADDRKEKALLKEEDLEQVAGGIDIGESPAIDVEYYTTWEVFPSSGSES